MVAPHMSVCPMHMNCSKLESCRNFRFQHREHE